MLIPMGLVVPVRRVGFDLENAVRRHLRDSGLKQEVLAALMGISAHQLSMQLACQGQLSFPRLLMASSDPDGRVFLRGLFLELGTWLGVDWTDVVEEWLRTQLTDIGRARMAKADLGNAVERKEVA